MKLTNYTNLEIPQIGYFCPSIKSGLMGNEAVVHENKVFSQVDYAGKKLRNREFIKCSFVSCDFSKSDLSDNAFEDCIFQKCDLSMASISGTGFRNASFIGCKLLGVDFSQCNKFMFSFSFQECKMDYCVFYGAKLKKTHFIACSLKDTEFSGAELQAAIFDRCDLTGTKFSNTNLEKADFRTAQNYMIDPDANKMKLAKFSALQLAGLLAKYQLDISFD